MKIIRGKIESAKKVVIYGPEGIGKSTFASQFPDPLFTDTEGSTKNLDIARLEDPSSWTMILEQIRYVKAHRPCKTYVVDTIDWAERLCIEQVCSNHGKSGIEDFGYGNGYVYVMEEFGRFLNLLEELVGSGIHVVLTAHAQVRKFEQPDEIGAYDRYELKLGKKTSSLISPLVKEWADMVLFSNYKTYSVAVDDKGKKHKAQGGARVMYTTHHPCWDAKNRYNLPAELPFEYNHIAHIFNVSKEQAKVGNKEQDQKNEEINQEKIKAKTTKQVVPMTSTKEEPKQEVSTENTKVEKKAKSDTKVLINEAIPKALRDLMIANNVDEWSLQTVVAQRGYYPVDTPITNYDQDFINGVLVGAWEQVCKMIQELEDEIPFN